MRVERVVRAVHAVAVEDVVAAVAVAVAAVVDCVLDKPVFASNMCICCPSARSVIFYTMIFAYTSYVSFYS